MIQYLNPNIISTSIRNPLMVQYIVTVSIMMDQAVLEL